MRYARSCLCISRLFHARFHKILWGRGNRLRTETRVVVSQNDATKCLHRVIYRLCQSQRMLHTREKFINALYNNVHFQVIGKYFAMVIRLDYYLSTLYVVRNACHFFPSAIY